MTIPPSFKMHQFQTNKQLQDLITRESCLSVDSTIDNSIYSKAPTGLKQTKLPFLTEFVYSRGCILIED